MNQPFYIELARREKKKLHQWSQRTNASVCYYEKRSKNEVIRFTWMFNLYWNEWREANNGKQNILVYLKCVLSTIRIVNNWNAPPEFPSFPFSHSKKRFNFFLFFFHFNHFIMKWSLITLSLYYNTLIGLFVRLTN